MGLSGSNAMAMRFSLPSSVCTVPVYSTSPFCGTLLNSFNRCCADVMASSTDSLHHPHQHLSTAACPSLPSPHLADCLSL